MIKTLVVLILHMTLFSIKDFLKRESKIAGCIIYTRNYTLKNTLEEYE